MNLVTLKKMILNLYQAGGNVSFVECKDAQLVNEVEARLNLQFPESIKSFYKAYEYLQVSVHEFVWMRDMLDMVNRIHARYPNIPKNYLPILSDGLGGYYYVVCAEQEKPYPFNFGMVLHNPAGSQGIYELRNTDFLDFVASKVTAELDELRDS